MEEIVEQCLVYKPLIVVIDKHSTSISTISHIQILLIFMFLTATSTLDSFL